jgi:hypothetical protein
VLESYLVEALIKKHAVLGEFSIKKKEFLPVCGVFLCLLASWESCMTPRQPIGVWQGGSCRGSSLLPIGHLGVKYYSQPHGYTLIFIVIRIRGLGLKAILCIVGIIFTLLCFIL